ncbi:MAG: TIGR01906 family membrane protein [Dehalococcoidia bacterium]|nr:TIGR01906 family membrane protein [Dehalococcoidia bacterium]
MSFDSPKLLSRFTRTVMLVLLIIAVPFFYVTFTMWNAFNSESLYNYGFSRYDADQVTGIDNAQLKLAGRDLVKYFSDDRLYLDTKVVVDGQSQPLFNEREILHMRDVKSLVVYLLHWGLWAFAAYIAFFVVAGYMLWQKHMLVILSRGFFWGGIITIFMLAAISASAVIGFDAVFTKFHTISFSNDLWQLDPRLDHLIQMFPEEFFRDAVLLVGGICILMSLVFGGIAHRYLRNKGESVSLLAEMRSHRE